MIKIKQLIIVFFFSFLSNFFLSQTIELKGKFELVQIIENFIGSAQEKEEFIKILNSLDVKKVKKYIRLVSKDKFEKAKKIVQNDSLLNLQDTRRIIALYCCYVIYKNNLLDYSILSSIDEINNGTINIFLTKDQLDKIKPELDKEIVIKTKFIFEIKYVNFKMYKLID